MALLIGAVAWQLDLEDDRAVRTFDLYLVAWAFLFQNLRGVFCRLLLVTVRPWNTVHEYFVVHGSAYPILQNKRPTFLPGLFGAAVAQS